MDLKNIKSWQIAAVGIIVPLLSILLFLALTGNPISKYSGVFLFFVVLSLIPVQLYYDNYDKTRKTGEVLSIGIGTALLFFGAIVAFDSISNDTAVEWGAIIGPVLVGVLFLIAGTHNSKPLGLASTSLILGMLAIGGLNQYYLNTHRGSDDTLASVTTMLFELLLLGIVVILLAFFRLKKNTK